MAVGAARLALGNGTPTPSDGSAWRYAMSNRNTLAAVPPMGWNSYTCYGVTVREEEVKANARYMAEKLRQYGWQYVVVDGNWFDDTSPMKGEAGWQRSPRRLDEYGRLLPDLHKFPGAAHGAEVVAAALVQGALVSENNPAFVIDEIRPVTDAGPADGAAITGNNL